jgi:hypothetical protein
LRVAQHCFDEGSASGSEIRIIPEREKGVVLASFTAWSASPKEVEDGAGRELGRLDGELCGTRPGKEAGSREDEEESDWSLGSRHLGGPPGTGSFDDTGIVASRVSAKKSCPLECFQNRGDLKRPDFPRIAKVRQQGSTLS